jgi:hypothetical protein
MMRWHLTPAGMIAAVAMLAVLLVGIHMIVWPRSWVGRGPIPARSAANVRAMGVLFAILGGFFTAFFAAPILLS